MEEKAYTINIRQTATYRDGVTVPEIGATKTAATIDSALNTTLHGILKHLTTRYLILVFDDQDIDRDSQCVDSQASLQTYLVDQAAFEVVQLGIAPYVKRRERHLMFEVTRPFTQTHATWLDGQAGKLFDRYFFKDEREILFDALLQKACENRKAASHE